MKKLPFLFASMLLMATVACDTDNDPINNGNGGGDDDDPAVVTPVEPDHLELSATSLGFMDFFGDTVEVVTNVKALGIDSIVFHEWGKYNNPDSLQCFRFDRTLTDGDSLNCKWLTMKFNDSTLSVNNKYDSISPFSAYLFEIHVNACGESVAISGIKDSFPLGWSADNDIDLSTDSLTFSADGGSAIVTTSTRSWWYQRFEVHWDAQNFHYYSNDDPSIKFDKTVDWVTVRRDLDDRTLIHVIVEPNPTSTTRTFALTLGCWNHFETLTGVQQGR